ncbi:hypothetical protein GCM10027565_12630 [Bordetella tumulicola]
MSLLTRSRRVRSGGAGLIETARPNQGPRPRCAGLPISQKAGAATAHTPATHSSDALPELTCIVPIIHNVLPMNHRQDNSIRKGKTLRAAVRRVKATPAF